MVEIRTTKMSSKGQIVIPIEMRKDLKEGDRLIIVRNKDQIILKKQEDFQENLEEDLEFARRTDEAFERMEKGGGTRMEFDKFIEEMKKW